MKGPDASHIFFLSHDSFWCAKTRACASRIMCLRFFDSFVDSFAKIRVGGVAGDRDHYFPIKRASQHRLATGNSSTVADRRSVRWILLCASTNWEKLVPFDTEEWYSKFNQFQQCFWWFKAYTASSIYV
jgi:hypothetical protein